ncbi:MAG: hypothetical protein AAB618_00180 [Patescibacteria group bacterium]
MVQKIVRAAVKRLTSRGEKPLERRLLIVIRAVDGDLVLQKRQADHRPRHHYKKEARTLLHSFFPPKAEKFCAKTKADDVFHGVLDFRRTSDIVVKHYFERDSVAWHPVLVDIAYIGLSKEFISNRAKKGGGMKELILGPLLEHPYREKLLKLFPPESNISV